MTLKNYLLAGDLTAALTLVDEMEAMSKDDKISTIASYAVILLLHLIRQHVEQHTTKSWDVSIRNCVRQINRKNKRRNAGGYYLTKDELLTILQEVFNDAIDQASLEVANGKYDYEQLSALVDKNLIIDRAMNLINHAQFL